MNVDYQSNIADFGKSFIPGVEQNKDTENFTPTTANTQRPKTSWMHSIICGTIIIFISMVFIEYYFIGYEKEFEYHCSKGKNILRVTTFAFLLSVIATPIISIFKITSKRHQYFPHYTDCLKAERWRTLLTSVHCGTSKEDWMFWILWLISPIILYFIIEWIGIWHDVISQFMGYASLLIISIASLLASVRNLISTALTNICQTAINTVLFISNPFSGLLSYLKKKS